MTQYVECRNAKEAKAKVITNWANGQKSVTFFGNPEVAEQNYEHKIESRMYELGAWTEVTLYFRGVRNQWIEMVEEC